MKTIKINRKKWLRGVGPYVSRLWDSNRQQGCCLGHAIRQTSHCSWSKLDGLGDPINLTFCNKLFTEKTKMFGKKNKQETINAARINDDTELPDSEREPALIKIFNQLGLNLEFYN